MDMSAKKQSKKTQKKKSFIITYDCPKESIQVIDGKKKTASIEKNLAELGKVEPLFPSKSTVRFWPNKKKKASKQLRKALTPVLESSKGSALLIEQPKGKIWTWPAAREKSEDAKASKPAKWVKKA